MRYDNSYDNIYIQTLVWQILYKKIAKKSFTSTNKKRASILSTFEKKRRSIWSMTYTGNFQMIYFGF